MERFPLNRSRWVEPLSIFAYRWGRTNFLNERSASICPPSLRTASGAIHCNHDCSGPPSGCRYDGTGTTYKTGYLHFQIKRSYFGLGHKVDGSVGSSPISILVEEQSTPSLGPGWIPSEI